LLFITQNYIIQLNVPNENETVTLKTMLDYLFREVLIEGVNCSACNTITDHTQITNIVNTNEYLYFQIQLWSNINTKISNLTINAVPTTTIKVDGT